MLTYTVELLSWEFSLDKKKVTFWINEVVNIEKKTITHINYKFISDDELLEINLAGRAKILALLCVTPNTASSLFQHRADLIPLCLFTLIFIPFPLPQITIPFSASLLMISSATACP